MNELLHSPVFLVLLTLAGYRLGREARERTGGHPLAQPVLVAIVVIGLAITWLDIDYLLTARLYDEILSLYGHPLGTA